MKQIMKIILMPLLCITNICVAQDSMTHYTRDTLYTKSGYQITDNQKLKLGTGTMPDGDFKFIRIASTSFFQYSGNNRSAVNSANSLAAVNRGFQFKVVKINKYGNKKHGYMYYPVINVGAVRYQIDVDNAIETGELDVPEQYRPRPKPLLVESKQSSSLADELAKLKKLYDDGTLTKDEYEAAKKKLINQ